MNTGDSSSLVLSLFCAHLSVFGVADRVGLSVLDSDGGHSEVTNCFFRELWTMQGNIKKSK